MRAVRVLVPVLGLLLGAAACSGGSEDGAGVDVTTTEADATTTSADATTTTAASTETTTFAQADTPPPIVNTGEDFDAIVRSFIAYGEWLSVHPDPARLADIMRVDSPAWQDLHPLFAELVADGLHSSGDDPGQVHEVRVQERPGADVVQLYLTVLNPEFEVLDASGAVVEIVEGDPLTAWIYELRSVGGRWLIERRTTLGPV